MAAAEDTSIDAGAAVALAELSEISGTALSTFTLKKSTPTATLSVLVRGILEHMESDRLESFSNIWFCCHVKLIFIMTIFLSKHKICCVTLAENIWTLQKKNL